jgi:hypothetical protein
MLSHRRNGVVDCVLCISWTLCTYIPLSRICRALVPLLITCFPRNDIMHQFVDLTLRTMRTHVTRLDPPARQGNLLVSNSFS